MLLAPFLWIFCEFDEKVLDNLSLVIRLKKTCHHNKYKLLGLCMEAASIEVAQRLMMQTFVIKNGTQEYAVRHKKNQND